jgi:hypothetical protein
LPGISRLPALAAATSVARAVVSVRPHRPSLQPLATVLVAVLVVAIVQASRVEPMLGATSFAARCDGVNLGTRTTTTAAITVRLKAGTKVIATARVSGGLWRTKCSGRSASGNSWYRITSINGESVGSRFGVGYLYGATSLFTPTPTPTPATSSVRVTSIPALLTALANNAVTEIVVANGTYVVPAASSSAGQISGLWIDHRFSSRTNPVLVRAEMTGGVTISGGGATGWIGIAFRDGVHDQTWQGFHFADADPTQTGVIVFGQSGSVIPIAPYNITLRDMTIDETITSANPLGVSGDHAVYFSAALTPGPHDILIDGLTVNAATSGLDTALHFYHSAAGAPGANNVTVRNMRVTGTDQAIVFWGATIYGIVIEDSTITNARQFAVRYEGGGTLTLRRVTSTGSGQVGFYSSLGPNPPAVTFDSDSFR